jgi:hypothetical protein
VVKRKKRVVDRAEGDPSFIWLEPKHFGGIIPGEETFPAPGGIHHVIGGILDRRRLPQSFSK